MLIPNEIFWIAAIIIFSVAEALTAGLVSIWFAGGALGGLITAALGAELYVQLLVFVIVSAVLVAVFRKVAVRSIKKDGEKTNYDRIIGQEVIISQTVDNSKNVGNALVNDVEWKVKSEDGEIIHSGEKVKVKKIEGVKLIVKK